jgi:hypothetical protein
VQYDEFEWEVMHTKHFDIYYYEGMNEIAEIGGLMQKRLITRGKQSLII